MRHADNTWIAAVDGVRCLAGAGYHNVGVHVGLHAFAVEIRSVDGTTIAGLGRVHGGSAAAIQACRTIIESGREPASTAIDGIARRIARGDDEPHRPDPARYDGFVKAVTAWTATNPGTPSTPRAVAGR